MDQGTQKFSLDPADSSPFVSDPMSRWRSARDPPLVTLGANQGLIIDMDLGNGVILGNGVEKLGA